MWTALGADAGNLGMVKTTARYPGTMLSRGFILVTSLDLAQWSGSVVVAWKDPNDDKNGDPVTKDNLRTMRVSDDVDGLECC